MSSSQTLREGCVDVAWGLWTELGVSGWRRTQADVAVDPEPLILLTAWLGDADPRLRDEATDWCARFGRYVAGARLRNIVAREPGPLREAFGTFAATVAAHSQVRWPGATTARAYRPTGRSAEPDLRRRSLIALRLRAVFGVGARAEVLRALLARRGEAASASDLADETDYSKRNVADVLDTLAAAGLVSATPVRNRQVFRLERQRDLTALVGPRPSAYQPWTSLLRILRTVTDLVADAESMHPDARAVEVDRTLRTLAPDLRRASLASPLGVEPERLWARTLDWAADLSARLGASGRHACRAG